MHVVESSKIIYCDVDDTLIIWDFADEAYDPKDLITVTDAASGTSKAVLPHKRHINLLREFKTRGHTVVVWSQGGWEWAKAAVIALHLEDIVDLVVAKPDWFIDDLPAKAFMGKNVYLHPSDPSKDNKRH